MWWWVRNILKGVFLCGLLFFSGCGYTFNHRLADRFIHPKGIYIPIFYNNTDEVGAEMAFTNALIRKLVSHGEHIASSEAESGLILKGVIQQLGSRSAGNQTITQSNTSTVYAYNRIPDQIVVTATIVLTLYETETKKQLWSQAYPGVSNVSAPRTRLADKDSPSSFGLITQSKIESSFSDIARSFAASAYDGMVEIYYGKK